MMVKESVKERWHESDKLSLLLLGVSRAPAHANLSVLFCMLLNYHSRRFLYRYNGSSLMAFVPRSYVWYAMICQLVQ